MNKLQSLSLCGFQVFASETHIPIRPLTLFFGPNSAGKSAVFDAIRLLHLAVLRMPMDQREEDWAFAPGHNRAQTLRDDWRIAASNQYVQSSVWIEANVLTDEATLLPVDIGSLLSREYSSESQATLVCRLTFSGPFPGVMRVSVSVNGVMLFIHDEAGHISINLAHPLLGDITEVVKRAVEQDKQATQEFILLNGTTCEVPASVPFSGRWNLDWFKLAKAFDERRFSNPRVLYGALNIFGEIYSAIAKPISHALADATSTSIVFASRTIPDDAKLTYLLDPTGKVVDPARFGITLQGDADFRHITESAVAASRLAQRPTLKRFSKRHQELEKDARVFNAINHALSGHMFVDRGYHLTAQFQALGKATGRWAASAGTPVAYLTKLALGDSSGRSLSFTNVGSGLGYVLPVLASIWSSRFSLIQQPELHLHPALQSSLADAVLDALAGGWKRTIVIETHSEHLLLRLLRRVKQTRGHVEGRDLPKLNADDLAIVYFNPKSDDSTEASVLRVSEGGEFLDRWPRGFFTERDSELFDE